MRGPRGLRSRFRLGLVGAAALALGYAASSPRAAASGLPASAGAPLASSPDELVRVRVAYAPLPVIGPIAVHTCFLVDRDRGRARQTDRFEVWQSPRSPGGHVHRSDHTRSRYGGVGGAEPWIAHAFEGEEARRLVAVLERSLADYPDRDTYRYWPGPNCNTYAAWVFRTAGVSYELHPRAIGKDHRGLMGAGLSSTGTGLQVENPVMGLKVGLDDGIELHPLGLTFGIDLFPPAIKTPLGRLGFDE